MSDLPRIWRNSIRAFQCYESGLLDINRITRWLFQNTVKGTSALELYGGSC